MKLIIASATLTLIGATASAQSELPQHSMGKVRDQVEEAREAASLTGEAESISLSRVITKSAAVKIKSTLTEGVLGLPASSFASGEAVSLFGAPPKIDILEAYQKNVSFSINQAQKDGAALRIWEGQPVEVPDNYLEAVLIAGGGSICTGVLVSPMHVITAAHCFCRGVSSTVVVGTTVSSAIAAATVDTAKSYTHISCDQLSSSENIAKNIGKGDFALYTLTSPVGPVTFRTIASESQVKAAAAVRAVGFGKTPTSIGGMKFLIDIQIGSYDCSETEINSGGLYRCTSQIEMIAKGLNRDTCGGDSGGPLYVLGSDVKLYLAAITSRSLDPNGSCGSGGIYAKLTHPEVRKWFLDRGVPASVFP